MTNAAFLLLAYFLGSLPFAVIVSRFFGLADPRSYGSGNPGATNVLRSGNKAAAALTLLGDALKGWLAVWLAAHYSPQFGATPWVTAFAGLAAFLGHVFPVFLGFRGGKGVATAAGVLTGLNPWIGLGSLGVWIAVAAAFRYSSLAALATAVAAPLLFLFMVGMGSTFTATALMAAVLVARHAGNIRRLLRGEEHRIGAKPDAAKQ